MICCCVLWRGAISVFALSGLWQLIGLLRLLLFLLLLLLSTLVYMCVVLVPFGAMRVAVCSVLLRHAWFAAFRSASICL